MVDRFNLGESVGAIPRLVLIRGIAAEKRRQRHH
jgi:hypothetical protein